MRIVITAQEEPVYFSPFLRGVINSIPDEIVLVVIAGDRGAGNHPRTIKEQLRDLYALWLMLEPTGFIRNVIIKMTYGFIQLLGPLGKMIDTRSIQNAAVRHNIPVIHASDLNDNDFIETLKGYDPDVIINQTELLFKKEILAVPRKGVINRHASILPHFRGRLGSFWSHANEPPEYGVTIHFVDEAIDSGPIILQKIYHVSSAMSYAMVLDFLFKDAVQLMLKALDRIRDPNFKPESNDFAGTRVYPFPSLRHVIEYRRILSLRRKR